jgi:hypothetical protein
MLAGRTGSSDRMMHMCFFPILLKKYTTDAEAIYKLWQFLSEGTLIKAMTVLMLSLEVSGARAFNSLLGLFNSL